jgi:hypothetical protein
MRRGQKVNKKVYIEKGFAFDPDVFEQPDGTDFEGYYQTEKYFAHCKERIRQEFQFKQDILDYAKKFVHEHRVTLNIIAVHVRRGDYLERPDLFQVLTRDYYDRALKHSALPQDRQLMIFSDDLSWCRTVWSQNEKLLFVESPSYIHDLAIMTQCDHYIISASSFSWWGAYLSYNLNNIVIAPTPWFPIDGPRGYYDMKDIIPERWIGLEVR